MDKSVRKLLGLGLGAAAIVLALAASQLAGPQAFAQGPTISVDVITVGPGAQGTVDLEASGIGAPGIGAWTIDLAYDPAVVTPVSCASASGGFCNPGFSANTVRAIGANANGLEGDTTLAQVTFACEQEGAATSIAVSIVTLVDATDGEPQEIDAKVEHGTVTCTGGGGPPPDGLLGDVNCDGLVNSLDALLILQLRAALIDTLPCPENGDVDGDGETTAIDAALILQITAGLIPQP